ncbi:copper resistance CopC family protein [Micromonospora sp. NBC_01796]|uniref:copper resistance CopC family protein n=1 Tax=Micromonospora sp. NBC_01796 TaxID=2975987 RepID=UPI002DD86F62|nr:copper resistance protein CopC [Micromonospora sp. NBC_01796]WSA89511.1 copper resistance protein CopC [Micromonospora sp. NBC_01796]
MRSTRLVTVRAACRLFAVVLGATIALAVAGSPASAHGQLAVSNPVAGATLSQPMQSLELYFTEAPAANAYFTVTAPSGVRVDAGWRPGPDKRLDRPVTELNLVNGKWEPKLYHTGFSAFVQVSHWPEKGEYTASYLSVASDREPVRGTVKFSYSGAPTRAPQGWSAPTNAADPALLALAENPDRPASSNPGAGNTVAPASPVPDNASGASDDGSPMVWLLPVLLLVGVIVIVALAIRPRRTARINTGPANRGRPVTTAAARRAAAARKAAAGNQSAGKAQPSRKRGNR